MYQIEAGTIDHALREPGEGKRTEEAGETNYGNLVKRDPLRIRNPPVCKYVNFIISTPRQPFGDFAGKTFATAYKTVFGNDYRDLGRKWRFYGVIEAVRRSQSRKNPIFCDLLAMPVA